MRDRLFDTGEEVHLSQVAVMIFIISITYKIVMLPKYLAMGAPRDFVVGASIAMLIEIAMFGMVVAVISYTNIYDMYAHYWVKVVIALGIIISSMTKLLVLSIETLDYISTMLFQEGRWLFIILTLIPALGYIAYRGANTIARMAEIVIWAVVVSFLFTLFFLKADIHLDNLLPIFDGGISPLVSTYMRHSMWFGDYMSLLVLSVSRRRRRLDKVALPLSLVATYAVTMGFFVLFVAVYGDVAPYIKYAFSNIGIYNSVSNMLGGVDFPIVCVWLLMAIVKLSLLLYSVTYSIGEIVRKKHDKKWRIAIVATVVVAVMLILSFAVDGARDMYAFATGWVRYVVLAVDVLIPLVLFGTYLVKKRCIRQKHTHI